MHYFGIFNPACRRVISEGHFGQILRSTPTTEINRKYKCPMFLGFRSLGDLATVTAHSKRRRFIIASIHRSPYPSH